MAAMTTLDGCSELEFKTWADSRIESQVMDKQMEKHAECFSNGGSWITYCPWAIMGILPWKIGRGTEREFHSIQVWETPYQENLKELTVTQGGSWPEEVIDKKCNKLWKQKCWLD